MADPKYKQIAQELMAEITAGKYQPTGRLPSEAQLVKRFDVSRPTAALALRQLQDQGLVVRRAGSGSFVRQHPGRVETAQQQIGLLVPEINETEILEVICGDLARLSRLHDFSLLWSAGVDDDSDDVAQTLCKPFLDQNVSGVFFAPFELHEQSLDLNLRITRQLRQAGVSVVLLDRDIHPFPARSEFDLVGIDNFASGYLAASHLLKLGCRRLFFLGPPMAAPTILHRIAGAREAALSYHEADVQFDVERLQPDDEQRVKAIAAKSDAIICSNDRLAATLMQT
ncbi:GntR family transcriptional regulator, partial [Novipirellula sp.]|uniref:GntR family transcriptional regulator n=1 Tax=Novipirellula sp. TaxID=2795430 RepID=UPI00356A8837